MRRARAGWLALGLLPLSVGGCPLTDDYFIDAGRGGSASNDSGGGEMPSVAGAASGLGGAPSAACSPVAERCNGRDDDCDEMIDEQACESMPAGLVGCSGFVIEGRPDHGYMVCAGMTRDYARAQEACGAQGMRLAWLESAEENSAVSAKVGSIAAGLEPWIGATDRETEGSWGWDGEGGVSFWGGSDLGKPVGNAFVAWAEGTPNNGAEAGPQGEDCAVLSSATAKWGDRACTLRYPYLCEEP